MSLQGANPNAPTLDGNTSLHLAATQANTDIILRLLQGGANPNVQNRYGQTPAALLLASSPGGSSDVRILCLEILTCAGCRLDKRDLFGRQASHLASISRDSHVVDLLRKLGSLNREANGVEIDIFGCSSVDYSHRIEVDKSASYLGSQMPNSSWKMVDKDDHVSRSARPGSVDDLIRELVAGTEVDLVDVVSFVLFLDSFSSLNEVVDRLSAHVRNGVKSTFMLLDRMISLTVSV